MNLLQIDQWLKNHKIINCTINPDLSVDVDGDVNLSNIKLTTFPFQFGKVTGHFYCYNNELKSLQYGPTTVGGNFDCDFNQLKSLQHCPTTVGGNFWCSYNELPSLQHCPTSVGGGFYCYDNQLESLQHCPTTVDGAFYCDSNKKPLVDGGKSVDNDGVSDEDIIDSLREKYVKQVMAGKINNKSFAEFVGDLTTV